jgi:hypothetical protein
VSLGGVEVDLQNLEVQVSSFSLSRRCSTDSVIHDGKASLEPDRCIQDEKQWNDVL